MENKTEYQKKPAQTPAEMERTRNKKVYVPKGISSKPGTPW
jgi:hypothetical protein